jgi:sugar phosphate isomerase/epimerase
MLPFAISCRPASYAPYLTDAFQHLPELGVEHIEIDCPQPGQSAEVEQALKTSGLRPTTVALPNELVSAEDYGDRFSRCTEFAAAWGARLLFASVNSSHLGREETFRRLRELGDLAAARGMTICLETHPDLVTNGDVGAATMRELAHPAVKINFDTANLYYYNRDVDAVGELRKVVATVASVHVKDTGGGYKEWDFPAIGEGVVDFPGVLKVLAEHGYGGPLTLEIEGVQGEKLTRDQVHQRVANSVENLRNWLGELAIG